MKFRVNAAYKTRKKKGFRANNHRKKFMMESSVDSSNEIMM